MPLVFSNIRFEKLPKLRLYNTGAFCLGSVHSDALSFTGTLHKGDNTAGQVIISRHIIKLHLDSYQNLTFGWRRNQNEVITMPEDRSLAKQITLHSVSHTALYGISEAGCRECAVLVT